MYLLIGIILIVVGIVMIGYPDIIYEIAESWKSNCPGDPSNLYKLSIRIGGIIVFVVGIVGCIYQFLL